MSTLPLSTRLSPQYTANALQTDFAAPFAPLQSLGVYVGLYIRQVRAGVESFLDLTDFTVVNPMANSFTARLNAGALAGDLIQVYGQLPAERDQAMVDGGALLTNTYEVDATSFQAQLQEHRRDLGRSFTVPLGESAPELPPAAARANAQAVWDGSGNLTAGVDGAATSLQGWTVINANAAIHFGGKYWIDSSGAPLTLTLDVLANVPPGAALILNSGDSAAANNVTLQMSGADEIEAGGQIGSSVPIAVNRARIEIFKLGALARLEVVTPGT